MPAAFETALRLAARSVVEDCTSLRAALTKAVAQAGARRQHERLALWRALPAAVADYQQLFANAGYAARQRRSAEAATTAMPRFAEWRPQLLGPAAVGLAADQDTLELALYTDEDEAVLRHLLDAGASFDTGERLLSLRADGEGRRCTTIDYAERDIDVRLLCLPAAWLGRPLYAGGLPLLRGIP